MKDWLVKVLGLDKRFGLKEAEAAKEYIQTPEQAKSVLAVVCGILEYNNKVTEDIREEKNTLATLSADAKNSIRMHEAEINSLKASIDRHTLHISQNTGRTKELEKLQEFFGEERQGIGVSG